MVVLSSNRLNRFKIHKVSFYVIVVEFKVRGDKLNPILKNTLFEMMNKEPNKRL